MCDLIISVGSKNPVKLSAALNGTRRAYPGREVTALGFNVASGVSDQPMSSIETKTGAGNRAKAAYEAYKSENSGKLPCFSVGLEGGVMLSPDGDLECFAWMAIFNGTKTGYSRTAAFLLPPRVRDLVVNEGMELGHADDIVFGQSNSKQQSGAVGLLTNGAIDRSMYYEHAVVLAYVSFLHPDLYV